MNCRIQTPPEADALAPLSLGEQIPVPGVPLTVNVERYADRIGKAARGLTVDWDRLHAAREDWQHWPLPILVLPGLDVSGQANDYGRILVNASTVSLDRVLAHELGHVWDFYVLTANEFRTNRDTSDAHRRLKATAVGDRPTIGWWSFDAAWRDRWHECFAEAAKEAWGAGQARKSMAVHWEPGTAIEDEPVGVIRRGIFQIEPDTHPGTAAQRDRDIDTVLETLDACRFEWWRAIRGRRDHPWSWVDIPMPIQFNDPQDGAAGYVSRRRMWLKPGVSRQIVAHELAHVADLAVLSGDEDRYSFDGGRSPWRHELMDLADHHDDRDHPHAWSSQGFEDTPWSQRPIEAVTVPWTRHYFDDSTFHYPESWVMAGGRRREFTHTWDDPAAVATIFEERPMQLFDDVDPDSTHADAILWAAEHGLVGGYRDGTFGPHDSVTRGQLVSILKAYDEQVRR